ncbi:hypothetical protein LAJ55_13750, partial [Streptococcus pneumoniae]|uniref:hypothetical protein n=1 Tax=Streptococcus pneumoniae TaxID=1313 RepID=UPI001CC0F829
NSGLIIVADGTFIDDTVIINGAVNVRPEAQTGFYSANGALAANTPDTVFAPVANVTGALLLSADLNLFETPGHVGVFITKASATTTTIDG